MVLSESAEECLERLWVMHEEGGERRVLDDLGSASDFAELLNDGLAELEDDMLHLTEKGKTAARSVIRRHRLAERLFHDVLEMGHEEIESPACVFEHILSPGVEEAICTLLGHPDTCPHGKAIPKGSCCDEERNVLEKLVARLSDMEPGQRGTIAYILTKDHEILKKLMAMGLLPGSDIELIQRTPGFVFQTGETQIAVDKEIAAQVHVRLYSMSPPAQMPRGNGRRRRKGWGRGR